MRRLGSIGLMVALAAGCAQPAPATAPGDAAKPAAAKLDVRPDGDTEIQPDLAQVPPEVQKVFAYIDEHIDEHVENLQKWIRQPSISNSGEGIPESAEMVKGFFDELGLPADADLRRRHHRIRLARQPRRLCEMRRGRREDAADLLDVRHDADHAARRVDRRRRSKARLVEQAPFKKVLIGRGATNSKGPQMSQLNAFRAIKAVHGKLPVNLIFVAEGDEERMDIGLRKFVKDHPELLEGADAMYLFGGQNPSGSGGFGGGSEGCVYVELTTSGKAWGRGPTVSDIHGANKRSVDSPAWRHIKMLASLVSDDGNTPLIEGFFEGMRAARATGRTRISRRRRQRTDMKVAAENVGVARYISDDPFTMLQMQRYGTSFNLDGIWGGNMYAGGAGAILPNKVTSKHNFRYVPNMHGPDIVKKLRAQLDKNGYKDVEVKLIGDVPWAKMNFDPDIGRALKRSYEVMNIPHGAPRASGASAAAARRPAATGRPTCSATAQWARRSRRSRACRSSAAAAASAAARMRPTSIT